MYYTVYKTTNRLNGKVYIGKHQTTNLDDAYLGSGIGIVRAIKAHGRENFIKEILFVFDTEAEMNAKEIELVNESFYSRGDNYNSGPGGEGGAHFKGRRHNAETKSRIGASSKGRKLSDEARRKMSETKRGHVTSEETRRKISASVKARNLLRDREAAISSVS